MDLVGMKADYIYGALACDVGGVHQVAHEAVRRLVDDAVQAVVYVHVPGLLRMAFYACGRVGFFGVTP